MVPITVAFPINKEKVLGYLACYSQYDPVIVSLSSLELMIKSVK